MTTRLTYLSITAFTLAIWTTAYILTGFTGLLITLAGLVTVAGLFVLVDLLAQRVVERSVQATSDAYNQACRFRSDLMQRIVLLLDGGYWQTAGQIAERTPALPVMLDSPEVMQWGVLSDRERWGLLFCSRHVHFLMNAGQIRAISHVSRKLP